MDRRTRSKEEECDLREHSLELYCTVLQILLLTEARSTAYRASETNTFKKQFDNEIGPVFFNPQ